MAKTYAALNEEAVAWLPIDMTSFDVSHRGEIPAHGTACRVSRKSIYCAPVVPQNTVLEETLFTISEVIGRMFATGVCRILNGPRSASCSVVFFSTFSFHTPYLLNRVPYISRLILSTKETSAHFSFHTEQSYRWILPSWSSRTNQEGNQQSSLHSQSCFLPYDGPTSKDPFHQGTHRSCFLGGQQAVRALGEARFRK